MSLVQTQNTATFTGIAFSDAGKYNSRLYTISANGLTNGAITVEVGSDVNMTDAEGLVLNGIAIGLSPGNNTVTFRANGFFRIVKSTGTSTPIVNVFAGL